MLVAFWNDHQRAVDRHYIIQEYGDVHCAWFGHAIIFMPSWKILMPLPDFTGECRLGINFELMHIHLLAKQLLKWFDQSMITNQGIARVVIFMTSKSGPGNTILFSPDLLPMFAKNVLRGHFQTFHFLRVE